MHLRNGRFPSHRNFKLNPGGDGLFQVLQGINDNAYKIDLPGEYNVSVTFNVSDLSNFDVRSYSRTNLFKEGGSDENQSTKVPLQMSIGPITRARSKMLQKAFNGLVMEFFGPTQPLKKSPS